MEGVRGVVAAGLPGYRVESVVPLGEGQDNVAFLVNGELVVRFRKDGDVGDEVRVLGAVAGVSSVATPVPVFHTSDCLAYFVLPGVPLADLDVRPPGVLEELVEFLGVLQGLDVRAGVDDQEPAGWLADARGLAGYAPDRFRAAVEVFLASPPPAHDYPLVFSHNDLGVEHVLVDPASGALTGVIDWTDAGLVDAAYDFGLLYRDFGPPALHRVPGHLVQRAVFYARCTALEDLAYGVRQGADRYARWALASMEWLFPG